MLFVKKKQSESLINKNGNNLRLILVYKVTAIVQKWKYLYKRRNKFQDKKKYLVSIVIKSGFIQI